MLPSCEALPAAALFLRHTHLVDATGYLGRILTRRNADVGIARRLQVILAVVAPPQHALFAQRIEIQNDLAAVAAAERFHEFHEVHGAGLQSLPYRTVRRIAFDVRRERTPVLDRIREIVRS